MAKKNHLLLLACRTLDLCLLKNLHAKYYPQPCCPMGISLDLILYTKEKLLPQNFCFKMVASGLISQYFALRSFPAPRSVESWWSLREEVHKQLVYAEDPVRGILSCSMLSSHPDVFASYNCGEKKHCK